MIQLRSMMNVADNTVAKQVQMIGMPKKGNKKIASIGDVVIVVINEAIPYAQVKKSEIVPVVIVRTRKEKKGKTEVISALMIMRV